MILRISVVFRHEMKLYERTFWGAFTYLFPSLVAGHFDQVALFHLVLGVLLSLSFEEIWAGALGGISGGISFWITLENLRWNLTITQLKRFIIFQTIIFRFHVYLPGVYLSFKFPSLHLKRKWPRERSEHIPPGAGKPENHRLKRAGNEGLFPRRVNHLKKNACLKFPVWFHSRKCLLKKQNSMVMWWRLKYVLMFTPTNLGK